MSRKDVLTHLRVAGYHDDKKRFMRLYVENRVAIRAAEHAFDEGRKMRAAGLPCSCYDCKKENAR